MIGRTTFTKRTIRSHPPLSAIGVTADMPEVGLFWAKIINRKFYDTDHSEGAGTVRCLLLALSEHSNRTRVCPLFE
jgi:hypothetical protein